MSRHAQLPPRCPLQKKTVAPQVNASVSLFSVKDTEFHSTQNGHYRTNSESFTLEEQPPWLNDLLNDLDLNFDSSLHQPDTGGSSRRLDGLEALPDLDQLYEKGTPDDELVSCLYGPNSPRRRNSLGLPENEIQSAFSEYVMQNSLMQHMDGYSSISGVQLEPYRDARASADEISSDNKLMRRHPGQRSRARKLQYISELERTVNVLQNLGSELSVRVASLIQQHAALSLENTSLKQQLIRMKQKKFIVDNENETLTLEVEMLRRVSTAANKFHSSAIWDMLDMRKLNLN